MTGSDIEALRQAVWAKLDAHYAIQWEPWYLINLEPQSPYEGLGAGLVFSYTTVERGVAWDGTLLLRKRRYRDEELTPWPGEFRDDRGTILACLPATPEHTQALEDFAARINSLREKLAALLTPQQIRKTLQTLHQNALLPPISHDHE